jgi:hypothetical protein
MSIIEKVVERCSVVLVRCTLLFEPGLQLNSLRERTTAILPAQDIILQGFCSALFTLPGFKRICAHANTSYSTESIVGDGRDGV